MAPELQVKSVAEEPKKPDDGFGVELSLPESKTEGSNEKEDFIEAVEQVKIQKRIAQENFDLDLKTVSSCWLTEYHQDSEKGTDLSVIKTTTEEVGKKLFGISEGLSIEEAAQLVLSSRLSYLETISLHEKMLKEIADLTETIRVLSERSANIQQQLEAEQNKHFLHQFARMQIKFRFRSELSRANKERQELRKLINQKRAQDFQVNKVLSFAESNNRKALLALISVVLKREKKEYEKTAEKLCSAELQSEYNDALIDKVFDPIFATVRERGAFISDEDKALYLDLAKRYMREGTSGSTLVTAEEREEYGTITEKRRQLEGRYPELANGLQQIGVEYGANQQYISIVKLVVEVDFRRKVKALLDKIYELDLTDSQKTEVDLSVKSALRIFQYQDHVIDVSEVGPDVSRISGGLEGWQVAQELLTNCNLADPELFAAAAREVIKDVAFRIENKVFGINVKESLTQLENVGQPESIPVLYRFIISQHDQHDRASALNIILRLINKATDGEQFEGAVRDMPPDEQEIIKLLQDPRSCLNKYARQENIYTFLEKLDNPKRILRQERYGRLLSDRGYPEAKIIDFYSQPYGDNLLSACVEVATFLGIEKSSVIEEYFDDLSGSVYLEYTNSLQLIGDLAKELDVRPVDIYHRMKSVLEKRGRASGASELSSIIESCRVLSGISGESIKVLVERFFPFDKVNTFYDNYQLIMKQLSEVLETPIEQLVLKNIQITTARYRDLRHITTHKRFIAECLMEVMRTGQIPTSVESMDNLFGWLCDLAIERKQTGQNGPEQRDEISEEVRGEIVSYFKKRLQVEQNPDALVSIMDSLINLKAVGFDDLTCMYEHQDKFIADAAAGNNRYENIIIDGLIVIDPTISEIFSNPKKLGQLKRSVINKVLQYIREATNSGKKLDDTITKGLLKMLEELRYVFESSDTTIIDKRLIFLDKYSKGDTADPVFIEKIDGLISEGKTLHEAMKIVVREDFEEILIESGNSDLERHYKRMLSGAELGAEERLKTEEKLARLREICVLADKRNRATYRLLQNPELTSAEIAEIACPIETSLTQVGPPEDIYPILDQGTLCDALLGGIAHDQENNLGSHITVTRRMPASGKTDTLRGRIASYGNPHGLDVDRIYGNISHRSYQPYGVDGTRDSHFSMGEAHQCITLGLPSSEITAIVLWNTVDLPDQKKYISMKNMFIPLLDENGKNLWSPEEFDQMKVFYYTLNRKGYPLHVIDNVYQYFLDVNNSNELPIQKVVVNKAFELVKSQMLEDQSDFEDLAVLVDFLKTNDLNTQELSWYEQSSYGTIMTMVRESVGAKNRWRSRELLFEYPDNQSKASRDLGESREYESKTTRKPHGFIDSFLNDQLGYSVSGDKTERQKAESHLARLLFRDSISRQFPETISTESIVDTAQYITEKKKELMIRIWNDALIEIQESDKVDKQLLAVCRKFIVPVMTGSGGRGEMTLGSDLDYSLLVDDERLGNALPEGFTLEQFIDNLESFVNDVLSEEMNKSLARLGIRADAGLAKKNRRPFSLISRIRQFKLEPSNGRQEEEPTEILNYVALFPEHQSMVNRCRDDLINKNPDSHMLGSYIMRDLEIGFGKNSFVSEFESLYEAAASGELLQRIKESLQRSLVFKLDYLIFSAFEKGTVDRSEAVSMPTRTFDLIDWMRVHNILSAQEAGICSELWAITYKIRFLGEVFSDEAKNSEELKKVKNIKFKLDGISFPERVRLIELLRLFKENVLYK